MFIPIPHRILTPQRTGPVRTPPVIAEATVPAEVAVIEARGKETERIQTALEKLRSKNAQTLQGLQSTSARALKATRTPKSQLEIDNINSQINLRTHQASVYDAQAAYLRTGKDTECKNYSKFMEQANLTRLGFIDKKKHYIRFKKGSSEYLEQIAKLRAAGIEWREIPVDVGIYTGAKDWVKDLFGFFYSPWNEPSEYVRLQPISPTQQLVGGRQTPRLQTGQSDPLGLGL